MVRGRANYARTTAPDCGSLLTRGAATNWWSICDDRFSNVDVSFCIATSDGDTLAIVEAALCKVVELLNEPEDIPPLPQLKHLKTTRLGGRETRATSRRETGGVRRGRLQVF
jgi:hypothetical protein